MTLNLGKFSVRVSGATVDFLARDSGRLIIRYNVSTLLSHGAFPAGLCLDLGSPGQTVPADDMLMVVSYLKSVA